ncbi:Hypothetical predicted protein [Paramuricea clavata]|uniref:Uncharacterized protein n=1 Tax=Paramuricea clavata TaxID=317549 RepID=A0A6S7IFC8_PARCT|nr:Hypothetical predicted protein [Paramuricea clavata]
MAQFDVVVEVVQAKEADEDFEKPSISTRFKNFCLRNMLSIGTIFSVIIGIFLPQPAVYLSQRMPVANICIIVLFFTIGLRLRLVEAKSAVKFYKEVIVGLLLVLFVGPVFATNVLNQVPYFGSFIGDEQNLRNSSKNSSEEMAILGPEEFRLALQIYYMCPSAPATSLILVTAANGHRGLSILLSILCVIISVFIIPPMLAWSVPTLQHVRLNVGQVLLDIMIRILLPLMIGRCLRCVPPVKKVVTKWNDTIKYVGIGFVLVLFLVKVSETSASGVLDKVSVMNILCAVVLGTGLATFNALSTYGFMSILPWFSNKSNVTLSILSCNRLVTLAATIVDVLPDNIGDKGLLVLPMVFIYLASLLMSNAFVSVVKVKEEDTELDKPSQTTEQDKDINNSTINSNINEGAIFTIYTDEMSVKDEQL